MIIWKKWERKYFLPYHLPSSWRRESYFFLKFHFVALQSVRLAEWSWGNREYDQSPIIKNWSKSDIVEKARKRSNAWSQIFLINGCYSCKPAESYSLFLSCPSSLLNVDDSDEFHMRRLIVQSILEYDNNARIWQWFLILKMWHDMTMKDYVRCVHSISFTYDQIRAQGPVPLFTQSACRHLSTHLHDPCPLNFLFGKIWLVFQKYDEVKPFGRSRLSYQYNIAVVLPL